MRFIAFIIILFPSLVFSQMEEKKKFDSENYVHMKAGVTFNETNSVLFSSLNSEGPDVFTPIKHFYVNPSVDIEFESHFSKYVGLSIDLGFMQTRQRYHYTSGSPAPAYTNNTPRMNERTDGLILSNIPHLKLAPCFYITESTRVYIGMGLYKYYYHFDPMDIGSFSFNLNREDLAVYSHIGICQGFDINGLSCSFSINCFGLAKQYDRGIQLAFGIVF